jgi:mono/diheme cytochrome c family protein
MAQAMFGANVTQSAQAKLGPRMGRAPTFVELANTPGMTSAALTVALTTPHAGMPMFVLTPEQRQDIIAYILSFKRNL